MPTFIIQGRYSHAAMQGLVAKPEDRAGPVAKLMEKVGGRLVSYYMTFGPSDLSVCRSISTHRTGTPSASVS